MIFRPVEEGFPHKSYFNDVIVSLLFTVKCKSNYLQMVIATCQFHDLLTPVTIILLKRKAKQNVEYKN